MIDYAPRHSLGHNGGGRERLTCDEGRARDKKAVAVRLPISGLCKGDGSGLVGDGEGSNFSKRGDTRGSRSGGGSLSGTPSAPGRRCAKAGRAGDGSIHYYPSLVKILRITPNFPTHKEF